MKRESQLFACHKFLEELGSNILICLAKVDFRNTPEIEIICNQLEDYVACAGESCPMGRRIYF